ncbi:MAG: hypothetical protein L0H79_19215 [Intrasporangium sp.]|uniref:hypothetical protein n=1 Tax=Intrasporangium sp. TaxID=1925024 RepID=UPI002647A9A9|nr:hypothetical protein [Intrasporangium sp.]MDN5797857.1 hypothetical protein [Intrasporangium sp.]
MSEVAATREIDDHELVGQADWVIGGDAARKGRRQAWYAGYVTFLAALAYGFPVVQAVVKTADPAALREQLASPLTALVVLGAIVAVLWTMYAAGTRRGPVVPPLPWIDHVVTTPVDRAVTVGRWWRLAFGLCAFLGLLTGVTVGAGIAYGGLVGWYTAGLVALGGAVFGWLAASLWLWGQVRCWPGAGRGLLTLLRGRTALRALHIEVLRQHAANSSTIGGSVVAGNLRTARLQLARPVRRARSARLRAGGPFVVFVRRDLLGMRRLPSTFWAGLGLSILGAVVLAWALTHPAVPAVAVTIGLVPAYFGYGGWAEGLRMQADNIGTPNLLGTSLRAETLAHLVLPSLFTLLVLGGALAVAGIAVGSVSVQAVVLVLVLVALLAGAHLLAAFRGSPPKSTFSPSGTGPALLIAWYLLPVIAVLAVGTLATVLTHSSSGSLVWGVLLTAAIVSWGLSKSERLAQEHRV